MPQNFGEHELLVGSVSCDKAGSKIIRGRGLYVRWFVFCVCVFFLLEKVWAGMKV